MYEIWTQSCGFLGSQFHPLTTNIVLVIALVFLIAILATETGSRRRGN